MQYINAIHSESTNYKTLKRPLVLDYFLLATTILLVGFSLVMVYSTTGVVASEKFGDPYYFVKRQAIASIAGLFLLFLFAKVSLIRLKNISPVFLFISIALLALILIPGIGATAGGAQRWIKLSFLRFQPVEFVKVMFVIFMAGYLSRHESEVRTFSDGVVKPFMLMSVVCCLLLLQPDFGSSATIGTNPSF